MPEQLFTAKAHSCTSGRVLFWAWFFLALIARGGNYYVSPSGNNASSGLSWQAALASVQEAITRASPGEQVWVAAGIYCPEEIRELDAAMNLASSFVLTDGVSLLGGFAGFESSPEERQYFDRDGNGLVEAWEFTHETILQGREDLAGQVVWGGLVAFAKTVLIDGFSIRAGRALGFAEDGQGGGVLLPGNCRLQNCLLTGNLARQGGGIAILGDSTVLNCAIVDNELLAEGWLGEGGGVLMAGPGAVLTNSLVLGNCRQQRGAWRGGAGVSLQQGGTLRFCTIVENFAESAGSGIHCDASPAMLSSCVIWSNFGPREQLRLGGARCENCAVQGVALQAGIIPLAGDNCGVNGIAVNDNRPTALYPCFQNPAIGDYRLAAGSYLLNRAGDSIIELDASLGQRCQCGMPDIGCYESPYKGNLTADFGVEMPLLYARPSRVRPLYGVATPSGVTDLFSHSSSEATWLQQGSEDLLCGLRVGPVEVHLRLGLGHSLAECWNDFTASKIVQVQPRPLFVAAVDLDWYWGSASPVLSWQLLAGHLANGDVLQGELACPSITGLGRYPIAQGSLQVADAHNGSNYRLTFYPGELRCLAGQAELQLASQESVYNGQPKALTVTTVPPGLDITLSYEGCGQTHYPATTEPPRAAGTYLVTACVQNELYVGSKEASLSIRPALLYCQAVDQEKVYLADNPPLNIRYSGFEAGDTVVDIVPPVASTCADKFSAATADGYPIILQGGQADNYQLSFQSGTLFVRPATPQIVGLATTSSVYGTPLRDIAISGQALHPLTGQLVDGSFIWESESQIISLGSWEKACNFVPEDRQNYHTVSGKCLVTILPRPIQVTANSSRKVYGDDDPPLTFQVSQGTLVLGDSFYGELTRAEGENSGIYGIYHGSLNLSDNYQLTYIPATFNIEARPLSVQADNRQKYEHQLDPVLTYQVAGRGLVNGDALSGSLLREAGEEPGEYSILQGDLESSTNYQLSFQAGVFAILAPALQLREEAALVNLVYGEALTADLLTGIVELTHTGEEIPGQFVWASEGVYFPSGSFVGDWLFLPAAGYDYPPLAGSSEILVAKAPLAVSVPASSRAYGQENPQFQLTFTGFVLQEDSSVLLTLPEVTCNADDKSLPGEYSVAIHGGLADNYDFISTSGVLTVEKIPLAVQVPFQSKQYGDPDPILAYACLATLLPGDSISGAPGRSVGEVIGDYTYTVGSLSLPIYYELVLQGESFRILPRQLTIKADNLYPLYGESIPSLTYSIQAGTMLPGDELSGELECWYNKIDADFPIEIGSLSAGGNYQINFLPGIFHFRKRSLTIKAMDCSKEYLSLDNFSRSWRIIAGSLVENDFLAVNLCRDPGQEIGHYAIRLSALNISPATLYEVTFISGTFSIVRASPSIGICTYHILYYGDPLYKANLTVEMREPSTFSVIPGEAEWLDPEELMTAVGRTTCYYLFTPEDQLHFAPTILSVEVTVLQLPVAVSAAQVELVYGEPLPGIYDIQTVPTVLPFAEQFQGQVGLSAGGPGDILAPGKYLFDVGTLQPPADNYLWTFVGGMLTVSKRPLTIQALDTGKYIGEDDPPLEYQIISGSLLSNDSFVGTLTRKAGQKVGEYPIRIGSLGAGANYSITFLPGVFRIRESPQSRSAGRELASDFIVQEVTATVLTYGQALRESTLRGRILSGGDQILQEGSFTWQEPELILQAGEWESAWTYTFVEPGKSTLTGVVRLRVLPCSLRIAGCAQKKCPGQPDPELLWAIAEPGWQTADLPFAGSLARTAGENPGVYATTLGSLSCGQNYRLDFTAGELIITAAIVVVDDDWKTGLQDGAEITLGEAKFYYCRDAFASLEQALARVAPGGSIYLLSGEYQSGQCFWAVTQSLTLAAWPGHEHEAILHGQVRIDAGTATGISVRGLTIMALEEQPALMLVTAADCCLENNLLAGGQPTVLVKEARGLVMQANHIFSDCACLVLGDEEDPGRAMTGVSLRQNHFSPIGQDLRQYWHLQIFSELINGTGMLDGRDNAYSELCLQENSSADEISRVKQHIGDAERPNWPSQSVLKFVW